MIDLDYTNLHKINPKHGLSENEPESKNELLPKFIEKVHSHEQGFYTNIDDSKTIQKIQDFAKTTRAKYSSIIILGIGGSALGSKCLIQGLCHLFQNKLKTSSAPNVHIIDNIDPVLINNLEDIIEYSKTLFIVISKSGSTPETITQYLYFRQKTNDKKLNPKNHFVFITDPEKGFLRETAEKDCITIFNIPKNTAGRFSALTAVGLLPALLAEIDINRIISGAKIMRDKFLNENFNENLPFKLAVIQYLLYEKGKNIDVLMPYSQKLTGLSEWYRQLLAESLGKKGKGITPIRALGATDQHSQLQLYNEGPNDKLIIFMEVEKTDTEITIPNPFPEKKELKFLEKNITFNNLMKIEKVAAEISLTKNDRPNITIKVDSLKEETLGESLMMFMGATAFLGELLQVNAFNQPGVEHTKKIIKQSLLK
ncbi:glucose-6-phosphate isomerase [Candidatus Peregrinibacteria bacterium]|nr:glucose-6-phosphate isomerase [Candidatus Peregrinibacteria bacterium]